MADWKVECPECGEFWIECPCCGMNFCRYCGKTIEEAEEEADEYDL